MAVSWRSSKFKWFLSFQPLHGWTLNFIGPFAKKLEKLLFPRNVVTGWSSSKCLGSSSHTNILLFIKVMTSINPNTRQLGIIQGRKLKAKGSWVTQKKWKLYYSRRNPMSPIYLGYFVLAYFLLYFSSYPFL